MKILQLLVSYFQNLQNDKFYSCKIKLVYSMFVSKNISRHHGMGKYKRQPITIQSFTIYLLSRNRFHTKKLQNFSSISLKLCLLGHKKTLGHWLLWF